MKKADIEKQLSQKIAGRMRQQPVPERFGHASGGPAEKKEQRERDKAAGLVPFAVKLPQDLVTAMQSLAREREVSLNELAAELLQAGLAAPKAARPAKSAKTAAKKGAK